ncbi:transcriptional regulator, MerR family [Novosphingobium aromaticivorans DSM 12444]|uniref:Mercuric resistance operon regulatory protein n=1 Tax=Novosphingobium aromaticivorans (strain ATCC 700278 / DSM 12444 / CCUG 56034 / CIP 105152 / NBRC 16084 / F199) TaxID=279238 RepID=Q2G6G2_NOVAD|nr:MerR family transcriptional regulator [Novosphingobium aromaticivorans]ABD26561.1 transcriptional regulator, MerR family [Novosphingobium aromaticivorans DSM 12444]SCY75598.1 transcriptional regulator, MerR family [Novosphingobium aromaticivorans]
MAMTISELAKGAGVGVETVRFYQRKGLLDDPRPSRTARQGQRHYGPEDLRRLRFVRSAQAAGFTLAEISELLALDAGHDRPRAREMARARLHAIEQEIARLEAARQSLRKLARECAKGDAGPCPIIAAFEG